VRLGWHDVTLGGHTPFRFTIIGQASGPDEKMGEIKGSLPEPTYELFVETCDDDRVCYPVVDRCVEVPTGTRFCFAASCDVEGDEAHVYTFLYDQTRHPTFLTGGPGTSYRLVRSSAVVAQTTSEAVVDLTIQTSLGVVTFEKKNISVTIVPILSDNAMVHYFYDDKGKRRKSEFRLVFRDVDSNRTFSLDATKLCVEMPVGTEYAVECPTKGFDITRVQAPRTPLSLFNTARWICPQQATTVTAMVRHIASNTHTRVSINLAPVPTSFSNFLPTTIGRKMPVETATRDESADDEERVVDPVAQQLVFHDMHHEYVYDSDTRVVSIPTGTRFMVESTCSDHRVVSYAYRGETRGKPAGSIRSAPREPRVLEICVKIGKIAHYVNVIVSPRTTTMNTREIFEQKPGHTVVSCADACGVLGKRFVPPWDPEQVACEECFLTRVEDPQGWTVVVGKRPCNYEPFRVQLVRSYSEIPFLEDDDGTLKVPYGSSVKLRVDAKHAVNVTYMQISDKPCLTDTTFCYTPTRKPEVWKICVSLFHSATERTTAHTFHLTASESDEELERLFRRDELARSIVSVEQTTKDLRESLQRTLEKMDVTQAKLVQLRVEQAKLK
jgi:hypothetical protein